MNQVTPQCHKTSHSTTTAICQRWNTIHLKKTFRELNKELARVLSSLTPVRFSVQLLSHKMGHPVFALQLIHVISNLNESGVAAVTAGLRKPGWEADRICPEDFNHVVLIKIKYWVIYCSNTALLSVTVVTMELFFLFFNMVQSVFGRQRMGFSCNR